MTGQWRFYLTGSVMLVALAGCGRSMLQTGERASWRHQAEMECLKSGAVKMGTGIVQIEPIEGPGMCGADFPLKVSALGEANAAIGYGDDVRPPAGIANSSQMPRWGRRRRTLQPAGVHTDGAGAQPAHRRSAALVAGGATGATVNKRSRRRAGVAVAAADAVLCAAGLRAAVLSTALIRTALL
jgi:hypothetical protein